MDSQIWNSATNTTSVANSSLVIQVSNLSTTGADFASTALYQNGSSCINKVAGSDVDLSSVDPGTWNLVRSSSITLTDDTEYMVCMESASGIAWIANAKIILDQSDINGVTDLEIVHQQINTLNTQSTTSPTSKAYFTRYNPDIEPTQPAFVGGNFTYYFESTLKTSAGTGYARLSTGIGQVSTTSTDYVRQRSADITSGLPKWPSVIVAQDLDTQVWNSATNTTSVSGSALIINVSNLSTGWAGVGYAALYQNDSTCTNQVAGSEVSITGTTNWTMVRSNSFALSDDTEYMVCVKTTENDIVKISNANIILDQSDINGVTDLEIVHQQINTLNTQSTTSPTSKAYFTRYNPDIEPTQPAFVGGNFTYYFESTLKTSAGTGYARLSTGIGQVSTTSTDYVRQRSADITSGLPKWPSVIVAQDLDTQVWNSATNTTSVSGSALIINVSNLSTGWAGVGYAALYQNDSTCTNQVAGSEVSITGTTNWTMVRSNSFALSDDTEYMVCVKTTENDIVKISNANIILDQSDINGVTATETTRLQVNTRNAVSSSSYSNLVYYTNFNPANADYVQNFNSNKVYFESTLKTSAGTGYARLSTGIGEIATTNTDYTRVRSSSLESILPTTATDLDTQIRNSATNTTSISSSQLILQNNPSILVGAKDYASNLFHGNITGDIVWKPETDCVEGKCLAFNGTNSFITAKDANGLKPSTFTISAWVNIPDVTKTMSVISKNATSGYQLGFNLSGCPADSFCFIARVGSTTYNVSVPTTAFPINRWHYVAATFDGGTMKLYVNGQEAGSQVATGSVTYTTNPLCIGAAAEATTCNGSLFDGKLDEIKLFPFVKSADDILIDYNLNAGSVMGDTFPKDNLDKNLILRWNLDESTAGTCAGGADTCDSAGFGNHGTYQNSPTTTTGKFGSSLSLNGITQSITKASPNKIPKNWQNGWAHRQRVTVSNGSGGTLTNYQAAIAINTAALIVANKLQSGCADIRLTDLEGNIVPYWIESCNTTTTKLWTKASYATGNSYYYLYYGNAAAKDASVSGNQIFDYFEGFDGLTNDADITTLSNWSKTVNYGSTYRFDNNRLKLYHPASAPNEANDNIRYTFPNPINFNHIVEANVTIADSNNWDFQFGLQSAGGSYFWSAITNESWQGHTGSWAVAQSGLGIGTTYKMASYVNFGTSITKMYLDDIYKIDRGFRNASTASTQIIFGNYGYSSLDGTWYIDNIIVRKYATTPPTVTVEAEEVNSKPSALTLSTWAYPQTIDASHRTILARGSANDTNGYDWSMYLDGDNSGKVKFTSDGSIFGTSQTTLSPNEWYNLTMVVNGNQTTLYINGQPDTAINNAGKLPGAGAISLGADADGARPFHGKLDEFRIYNIALSSQQVQELYQWTPGPLAHYTLDEGSGSEAHDRVGYHYSATLENGASWATGQYGYGVKLDGTNDHLSVASTIPSVRSLSFWVKPEANTGGLISLNATSYITLNSGTITTTGITAPIIYVNNQVQSSLTLNQWQYVTITTATPIEASALTFGLANGSYLNGSLDDIRLFDYALNQDEITRYQNADHPLGGSPISSSVLHWKLDEGYDATAHNSGSAKSAYNGTINSGTWTTEAKLGKALELTASTSVVATITDPGSAHTLALWLYPTTSAASKTIVTAGKLTTDASSRPVYGSCVGTALPLNQWTHLAVISNDSTSCAIYQNGIQTAVNTTGVTFGTTFNLGNSSFTGRIDEVKLYTAALTKRQLAIDANAGSGMTMGVIDSVPDRGFNLPQPIGLWNLNENTNSTAKDTSGNNRHGTLSGTGAHWATGKVGSAIRFNGTDDQLAVSSSISGVQTLSFWINPATSTTPVLTLSGTASVSINSNTLSTTIGSATIYVNGSASTTITPNTWQHITITTTSPITADAITVGKVGTSYYTGLLDHLVMYSQALTPTQISYSHNQGAPLLHFMLDDCQGSSANNAGSLFTQHLTISIGATGTNTSPGVCNTSITTSAWNNGKFGKFGASINLDGTDDYASITDTASVRFDDSVQDYTISSWIKRLQIPQATGGTVTEVDGYRIHTFTDNGTFTVSGSPMYVEVLVVAGGGGGSASPWGGGGGGGGGIITHSGYLIAENDTASVFVGMGGAAGATGSNSSFGLLTAFGGGRGDTTQTASDRNGGSGGGAGHMNPAGTVSSSIQTNNNGGIGYGHNGGASTYVSPYNCGSGGGAGASGTTGGVGGIGISSNISGTTTYYGGGGGMANNGVTATAGGNGGGGAGRLGGNGYSGTANTGGGGGGSQGGVGGSGGSGIVIVRYPIPEEFIDNQEQYLVSKEDADNDGYRLVLNADDTVTCSINNIDITTIVTISDADWHHVACTIDRDGDGKLYIDGKLEASVTFGAPIAMATTANLTIGTRSYSPTTYFVGQLDELRIHNYALTEEQIRIAINQGGVSF
jgi:hypothetical protein